MIATPNKPNRHESDAKKRSQYSTGQSSFSRADGTASRSGVLRGIG